MRRLSRVLIVVSLALVASPAASAMSTAVEYCHSGYDHYFITASPQEIAALDAGGASAGWSRTGESFEVLDVGTPGSADVCRFWSGQTFAPSSSHFYTPFARECEIVKGNPGWRFEGAVFALMLPDAAGKCATGTVPLYRLYNRGQGGAPNHRCTTSFDTRTAMVAQGWIPEGSGIGVIGCVTPAVAQENIQGRVVDGSIEGALVCLDSNRNGRCDASEPQTYSDAAGAYRFTVPKDSTAPLLAEIVAGRSHDSDEATAAVDVSFRMASPSRAYGTDITPFSTLALLSARTDRPLADDLVRDVVGLPPRFDIGLSAPAAPGSLKQRVAKAVVAALKAKGLSFDLTAPGALASVAAAFPTMLTDLPALRIRTKNGAAIESKEVYVDATYVLTNPAAAVPDAALNGKIRGRGHSTWGQPKNPYKVQFANDANYAAISDVLGMKKQRNWALLADYFDRSLIRNKLAFSLGNSSVFADGLKWTSSGQHVEVWLNDDYVGVYLLTEDIRIDAARLNLKKMSSNVAVNDLDGGYIVEVDERLDCYKAADLNLQLVTPQGVPVCIDTPDEEAITPNQLAYIKDFVVQVEADVYGPNRLDRINPTSFADWYLLQELFRNNDAIFLTSDFMWKDTDGATDPRDRLLNMGPIWDFDRGAGNVNYNDAWKTDGCWVSKEYQPNWISRLFDNPDFLALTLARWKEKRPALEAFVNAGIDTYARRLAAAQERNFQRWPILGVPMLNYYYFATWGEEVGYVRQFLNERMAWLDQAYASPGAFNAMCK